MKLQSDLALQWLQVSRSDASSHFLHSRHFWLKLNIHLQRFSGRHDADSLPPRWLVTSITVTHLLLPSSISIHSFSLIKFPSFYSTLGLRVLHTARIIMEYLPQKFCLPWTPSYRKHTHFGFCLLGWKPLAENRNWTWKHFWVLDGSYLNCTLQSRIQTDWSACRATASSSERLRFSAESTAGTLVYLLPGYILVCFVLLVWEALIKTLTLQRSVCQNTCSKFALWNIKQEFSSKS